MDELEITQPEEQVEGAESTERVEEQALQEAAAEPGARVEETQTFEQAEAVEAALTEAVDTTEQVEVTPVPIPTPEPAEDDDDMQLISGPDRKDLPDGTGILEEPHETVEMADKPEDRAIADVAEVPEGIEFELAGDADEAGTVDRDDHPMADPSELSEASDDDDDDDDKDEATPINIPGPVAEDDDEGMQLISGPDRKDLPDGTGILEEPHETVEMAEGIEDRGIADVAEVPEGIEFKLAGEDGTVGRDDDGLIKDPDLSEASGGKDDDDKDEVTPINLPGPEAAVAQQPDPGPDPNGQVELDHPGPGGQVAQKPDPEPQPEGSGVEVSPIPLPLPRPADENLQPAPDFADMNPSEQSVVEIISQAISNEDYRGALFADAKAAIAGYEVTGEDQTALGEMTTESFDFFAAEVEARFSEAMAGSPEIEQQSILAQVVHAVWRDLNPGGLAYVLAYKIPQKHLS